jgi:hypothetical protein
MINGDGEMKASHIAAFNGDILEKFYLARNQDRSSSSTLAIRSIRHAASNGTSADLSIC